MELERIFKIGINIESFDNLGILMIASRDTKTISEFIEKLSSLFRVRSNQFIFELINDLDNLSISPETKSEIEDLKESIIEIFKAEYKGESIDDAVLSPKVLNGFVMSIEQINNRIIVWKDRIINELKKRDVIELVTDTDLNPNKLKEGGSAFFNPELWKSMSDLQKADFNDGCKCVVVGSWTPAGMIIMRSIESAVRTYYNKITDEDPTEVDWGKLQQELSSAKSVDKKLLGHLSYLKDLRNELQHPDKRLDRSEAENILTQAIHVFKRIY